MKLIHIYVSLSYMIIAIADVNRIYVIIINEWVKTQKYDAVGIQKFTKTKNHIHIVAKRNIEIWKIFLCVFWAYLDLNVGLAVLHIACSNCDETLSICSP